MSKWTIRRESGFEWRDGRRANKEGSCWRKMLRAITRYGGTVTKNYWYWSTSYATQQQAIHSSIAPSTTSDD